MTGPPSQPNGATVAWRLGALEEQVKGKADADDLERVLDEIKGIRRLLVSLLVSIIVVALGALFTIVQIGGHP